MHGKIARLRWILGMACAGLAWCALASAENADGRDPWQVTVGAGAGLRPKFPGSDSTEVRPIPAFEIVYADRWFASRDGLGGYVNLGDRWQLSASVAPEMTHRDESDSPHLRGLGDVDRTAIALVRASYRMGFVTATAAVSSDIADKGHGTVLDLVLQADKALTPRWSFNYGVGARWVNDEYMTTFFGIDAQQSERSGLAQYQAGAGVSEVRAFGAVNYLLGPNWILSCGAAINRLQGDASDSPIVQDDTYATVDAVAMYRF